MPLNEMFMELSREIDMIKNEISWAWDLKYAGDPLEHNKDYVHDELANVFSLYADKNKPTYFLCTLDKFVDDKGFYIFPPELLTEKAVKAKFSSLPAKWQDIINSIYTEVQLGGKDNTPISRKQVRACIKAVASTGLYDKAEIKHPVTGQLITTAGNPEEKLLATDALKAILPTIEDYTTWYDKVMNALNDPNKFSKADIEKILAGLGG